MQIINKKKQLSELISSFKKAGKSIGFVPTMGALHEGHLSLVQTAQEQCDMVVVSIFVNPTQFDKQEDLEKYPQPLESDLALLQKQYPKTIIFVPSTPEVYGGPVYTKTFDFGHLENSMEGKHRIGHFDGVGTVLNLLFDIVRPEKAFFGEKDFQQLLVVRKMVSITGQCVDIVGCPIAREPSGLARSSRNERLSRVQRSEAAFIYKTLQRAKAYFGTKSVAFITNWVHDQFNENLYFELEYFEIAESNRLEQIGESKDVPSRAFIAAYADKIRLIDNIALN